MTKKIGFGVLGLGDFGVRHIKALKGLNNAEVVAVCSRTETRAKTIAKEHGISRWYTDRRKMLNDSELEAVSITTADDDHVLPVQLAVEAGKHVLLEKPMATNLGDADKILDAVHGGDVIFMVGHICRFDVRYKMIHEMSAEGRLGKIHAIYARRNVPKRVCETFLDRVSPVVQAGVHEIDVMNWILGRKPISVYSEAVHHFNYKHPEIYFTLIRFDDGAVAVAENNFALVNTYPHFIDVEFEVIASNSIVHISTPGEFFSVYEESGISKPDVHFWPEIGGYVEGALRDELQYFANCVEKKEQPSIIRPEDARLALQIAVAAESSAAKHSPIELS